MLTTSNIQCIERVRLGFIATVTAAGKPAVSPKGTFVVLDENTIAFGNIRSPGTIKNLEICPDVEVNFVDPFVRKGLRLRGRAHIWPHKTPEFDRLIANWQELWGDLANRIKSIVMIKLEAVAPLSTPPYDDGVSEAEMILLYKAKYAEMYP